MVCNLMLICFYSSLNLLWFCHLSVSANKESDLYPNHRENNPPNKSHYFKMVSKNSISSPLSQNFYSQANGKQADYDWLPDSNLKFKPMNGHICVKNKFAPRKAAENLVKFKSKRQLSLPVMNMKVPLPYIGIPYPFLDRQTTFDASRIPGYITQGNLPATAYNLLPHSEPRNIIYPVSIPSALPHSEPRNIIYPVSIPSAGVNSIPSQYSPVYIPLEGVRDYKQPVFNNPNTNLVLARNDAGHIEYLNPSNEGQQVVWLINRNNAVNSIPVQNNQVINKSDVTEMPDVSTMSVTSLPVKKTWKFRNIGVPESHQPAENKISILDDNAEIEDVPGIPLHTNLYSSSIPQKYELTKKLSDAKTPAEMLSLIGRPKVKLASDVQNVNFIDDDQSDGQDELSGDQSGNDCCSGKSAFTDSSFISTVNCTNQPSCTNTRSIEAPFISRPDFSFVNAIPDNNLSDQGVSSSFKESSNNLSPECGSSLDIISENFMPIPAELSVEVGVVPSRMQNSTNAKSIAECAMKRISEKLVTVGNGRKVLTNKSQMLLHTAHANTTRNENKYVKVIKALGSEIVSHLVELEHDNAVNSSGQNLIVKEVGWLKQLTEKLQGCLTQKSKVLGIQNRAGVSQLNGVVDQKKVAILSNATFNREVKNKRPEGNLCPQKQLGKHHKNEDMVQTLIPVAELHDLNQTSQTINCASKSSPLSNGIADLDQATNILPRKMPRLIENATITKVQSQQFTNGPVSTNMLNNSLSLLSLYTKSPSDPLSRETLVQNVQHKPQLDSPSEVNNLDGISLVIPDNPNILSCKNVKAKNAEKEYSSNSLNGHSFADLEQVGSADLETGHDPHLIDISAHNGPVPLQYIILNPAYPNKEVSSIAKAALPGLMRQDTRLMYGVGTKETIAAITALPKLSTAQQPAMVKDAIGWQSPIIVLPLKGNLLLPLRSNISVAPNNFDINRLKRLSQTNKPRNIIAKRLTPPETVADEFRADNRYLDHQNDVYPGDKVVHLIMEQFGRKNDNTVQAPDSLFNQANHKQKTGWSKSLQMNAGEIIRPAYEKCNSSTTRFMFEDKDSAFDENIFPDRRSNALAMLSADVLSDKNLDLSWEQKPIKAVKNTLVDRVGGLGEHEKPVFCYECRKDKRSTNLSVSDRGGRNNINVKNGLVKFGTDDEKIKRVLDIMADINNYFVSSNDKLISLSPKSKTNKLLNNCNSENDTEQKISSTKTDFSDSSIINKFVNKNINNEDCLQGTITSESGLNMSSNKTDFNGSNIINKICSSWYNNGNNDDCTRTIIVSGSGRNNASSNSVIENNNNSNHEIMNSVIGNDSCLDPTIASKMKVELNSFSKGKATNLTCVPILKVLEELEKLIILLEILPNEKKMVQSSPGFNNHSHLNNALPCVDNKPCRLNKQPLNNIDHSKLNGCVTDANCIPEVVEITNELSKLISLLELKKKMNKTWRQGKESDLTSIVQGEKNNVNNNYLRLFSVLNQTDKNQNHTDNSLETQSKHETSSNCNKLGKIGVVSGDMENSEFSCFLSKELSHLREKLLHFAPFPDVLNMVDALLANIPCSRQRLKTEHTILPDDEPDDELDDATSYAYTSAQLLSTTEFKADPYAYTTAPSLYVPEFNEDQYTYPSAPLLSTTKFKMDQCAYTSAPLLLTMAFKVDQYTSVPLLSTTEFKAIHRPIPIFWNGYIHSEFNKTFSTAYPVQLKKGENMSLSSRPDCSTIKTFDNKSTDAKQCMDMNVSVPFNIIVQSFPQNRTKQHNGQCPQVSSRATVVVDPSEIIVKYEKFQEGTIHKPVDDVKAEVISSPVSKHECITGNQPTVCTWKTHLCRADSSLQTLVEDLFDTASLETHYDQQIILPDRIATYAKQKSVYGKS